MFEHLLKPFTKTKSNKAKRCDTKLKIFIATSNKDAVQN